MHSSALGLCVLGELELGPSRLPGKDFIPGVISLTFHIISWDRVSTEPWVCYVGILARLTVTESLGSACLSLQIRGLQAHTVLSRFYLGVGGSSSGPPACTAKHFATELSPQPSVLYFYGQILPTFCMAPWFLNESCTASLLLPSSGMLREIDKPWNYRVEL